MRAPKRPVGRPPLVDGDTPARVHVTVPSRDYDRADRLAQQQGISVPAVLRRGLRRLLGDDDPPK